MKKFLLILIIIYTPLLLFSLWQYHLKILWANYNLNQAEAALGQNNFSRTFQKYEKALQINTKALNPYLRYRYGSVALSLAKLNKYLDQEQNLEILKRGIELQEENEKKEWPYFTRNYIVAGRLSNFLFEAGQKANKEIAIQYFNKALSLSPQRPSIYLDMAKTAVIAKNYDKAEEQIKKAMSIDDSNVHALWLHLLLKIRQKEWQRAKENYHINLAELNYGLSSFEFLNELARIYEETGDFQKSITYWQELSEKWPRISIYQEKVDELLAKSKTKE